MKSGLEDRNNAPVVGDDAHWVYVSMKSGLEDRNNRLRSMLETNGPSSQ